MAYERQIQLCNAASIDYWCCVPAQVDDDYVRQLAALIKSQLNANLRVYLEYSNETWNGQFNQAAYVNAQGKAQGLPGSNEYYQGGAFTAYRVLQMAKIFADASIAAPRLVPVFAYSGNTDIGEQAVKTVAGDNKWNSGQKLGLIATAPYVEAVGSLSAFKAQVDSRVGEYVSSVVKVAKSIGAASATYEGGCGAWDNAVAFRKAAWSYDAILYWYQQIGKLVNGPICNYTLIGKWGSTAWGHYDHVGQPLSEARGAQAAIDWASGK
jgi:hypothetical protein